MVKLTLFKHISKVYVTVKLAVRITNRAKNKY